MGSVADQSELTRLVEPIAQIIEQARAEVRYAVNQAMVQSDWQIGKSLLSRNSKDKSAQYGAQQLKQLSHALTERLGKGFDVTNLRNMRRFYLVFLI